MQEDIVYDTIVVGAGFFGCMIAQSLPGKTLLIEESDDIMKKASVNNQARVHNGYHYPRSHSTMSSSHKNFHRFISEFSPAISHKERMLYAIARGSKTNSHSFIHLCQSLGLPLSKPKDSDRKLFNQELIENVFEVEEPVFNGDILRWMVRDKIKMEDVLLDTTVLEVVDEGDIKTVVTCSHFSDWTRRSIQAFSAKRIILCAYAGTNNILKASRLPQIPMIVERTTMPLVVVPTKFRNLGITIMDGDYFSIMPFPMRRCHSIHHVKHTPRNSVYQEFHKDVSLYLPGMRDMGLIGCIEEDKVIFPQNDFDDGRPILCRRNYGMDGLDIVVGGKLDNIYDVLDFLNGEKDGTLNVI